MADFPKHTQVLIIGGGVVGCSVAYHLAHLGWSDVTLVERKQLTCGTTWHAAGLIAQLRATINMTRLAKYSQELYGKLEEETGIATGFKRNGSLAVARAYSSPKRPIGSLSFTGADPCRGVFGRSPPRIPWVRA